MISEPTVEVWARSTVTTELLRRLEYDDSGWGTSEIDLLHEAAGRACYESWGRPNPKTATTRAYLDHILEVGHHSVLAHGSITMYFTGVSRSLTHELVRSRFLAFSQVSQRYVDSSHLDWVCPPAELGNESAQQTYQRVWDDAIEAYDIRARHLELQFGDQGYGRTQARKQAREAARAVLPNMTETRIVVSGNVRAWRDFIGLRWSEHADVEIDRLAAVVASRVQDWAPYSIADLKRNGS